MLAECGPVGATDDGGEGPSGGPVAGPKMLENEEDEEEDEEDEDDEGEGREMRGAVPPDEEDGGEDPGGGDRAPPRGVDEGPP